MYMTLVTRTFQAPHALNLYSFALPASGLITQPLATNLSLSICRAPDLTPNCVTRAFLGQRWPNLRREHKAALTHCLRQVLFGVCRYNLIPKLSDHIPQLPSGNKMNTLRQDRHTCIVNTYQLFPPVGCVYVCICRARHTRAHIQDLVSDYI